MNSCEQSEIRFHCTILTPNHEKPEKGDKKPQWLETTNEKHKKILFCNLLPPTQRSVQILTFSNCKFCEWCQDGVFEIVHKITWKFYLFISEMTNRFWLSASKYTYYVAQGGVPDLLTSAHNTFSYTCVDKWRERSLNCRWQAKGQSRNTCTRRGTNQVDISKEWI